MAASVSKTLWVMLLGCMIAKVTSQDDDPCNTTNILQHNRRVLSYQSSPLETEECDRYLPHRTSWYRIDGDSRSDLVTHCPDLGQCGTLFPIWLNGSIPDVSEGIVNRTACKRGFFDEACCETRINIKLKNCGNYTVAYLQSLRSCPGKYCFDYKLLLCPPGQSSESGFMPCTTSFAHLNTRAEARVEPFLNSSNDSTASKRGLSFHCNRISDGSMSSYFFDVNWYIDGKLVKTISKVPHSRYDNDTALGEDDTWRLPMMVSCSYRARSSLVSVPSPAVMSDEFFAGLKIFPEGVIEVSEGSTGAVSFRSTIPVPCLIVNGRSYCDINFENAVNETHGGCTLSGASDKVTLKNGCGFLFHGANWNFTQSMPITAITDGITGDKVALIRLSTANENSPLWTNYTLPEIKVIKRDRNRRTMNMWCTSWTDVHIHTFDGNEYETDSPGWYLLYKHNKKPIEVMTITEPGTIWGTVNCAVSVKAGNDIYIAYLCQNNSIVDRIGCQDGNNLEVFDRQQGKYTLIILPTGTKVWIEFHQYVIESPWVYLQISIYPSPEDYSSVTGLCGNLDGVPDETSDLTKDNRLGNVVDIDAFLKEISYFQDNQILCLCANNTSDGNSQFKNSVTCDWRTGVSCTRMNWNVKSCPKRLKRDAHLDEKDWVHENMIYATQRRRVARSTWTLSAAKNKCLKVLEQYASFNKCRELLGVNVESVLDGCAVDVVRSGEVDWIPAALEIIKSQCINILDVDMDLWIKTLPGTPSQGEIIFAEAKCPTECNNNGHCLKGVCQCKPDFVEEDCSVNLKRPPTVERLTRNGVCDLSNPNTSCSATHVFGINFHASDSLTCRVKEFMIDKTGVILGSTSTTQQAVFENFRQIMCTFPDTKTFSTPHDGIGVHGYYVEVSNNGAIYSKSLTFIAYDPRCHQCDIKSMICSRKADSCLIEGKCYTSGEAKPTEPHMKCTPTVSGYHWTQDTSWLVRLVGGYNDSSGRVEVRNSTAYPWGTVCDDSWDYRDATVVCRRLGYTRGISYNSAQFGRGTGEIVLDNLACSGSESSLQDCGHNGWGRHNCGHHEDAGVACFTGWQVRLAGGNRFTLGRVEMRNSTAHSWGTVCDDNWDYRDATVVCRMFGFEGGRPYNSAHFGQGSGEIVLDNVACSGLEYSLQDCPHQRWGSHNCGHQEDAGVECFNDPRWQLRLAYGNSSSGRVEVKKSTAWGTICDNNWNDNDATVVCRTLGYNRGHAFSHAHFGVGTAKSSLDDVACLGSEPSLAYCYNQGMDYHYCGRNEYSGVVCSDGWQVRLVGGNSTSSGRVEVRNNTAYSWGTVCDYNWNYIEATVVCRMLGYEGGRPYRSAHFGQGTGEVALEYVRCSGSESYLSDCRLHQRLNYHYCGHSRDAGVACVTDQDWQVRLVGGNSSFSGRVEVRNSSRFSWGTVCDDIWGNSHATVVCRMLGYYGGQAYSSAHFGAGTGEIVLDNVACSGSEPSLQYCWSPGWGSHNCGHNEDAGVACFNDFSVQLVGGTSSSGRVEVRENESSAWGTVCDTYWDYRDATVTCHKLGYNWGEAHSDAFFGTGSGPIYIDKTNCVGSEGSLTGCRRSQWGVHNCTHSQDAGVSCHNVSVRLVNGTSTSGRVELRWNDTSAWGTVCDNGWDTNDAKVVCRMLGLTGGRDYQRAYFGEGTGDEFLYYTNCNGNELSLSACSHRRSGGYYCGHSRDAGVACDDPDEI